MGFEDADGERDVCGRGGEHSPPPSCTPKPPRLPLALTDVKDAIARAAPPPALQLLLLRVLQPPVVEDHPHHALSRRIRPTPPATAVG